MEVGRFLSIGGSGKYSISGGFRISVSTGITGYIHNQEIKNKNKHGVNLKCFGSVEYGASEKFCIFGSKHLMF